MLHRIQDQDAVGLGEALELVSQGFVLVRPDGRVGFVNKCAIKLLELPAWLISGPCRYRDLMTWQTETGEYALAGPEHRAFVEAGAMTKKTGSFQYVRPNGTVLEVHYVPLKDRAGGFVVSYVDVTERHREAAALSAGKQQAERDAQAKENFFAMMSHEMRTPLNGVLGLAEILSETDLDDEQREKLDILRASGADLLRIINAVLDFSKMNSSDGFELEIVPIDLRQALDRAVGTVRAQAESKGLEFSLSVGPDVPNLVEGDAARLRQVLLNLLGNAVKFTAEGSVKASVSMISASNASTRLRFAVEDTGIGIPAEAMGSLFDAFTQVDASISRRFGGTGLGLAISRKIIEKMGSRITVESAVGRGSTFSFELDLPIAQAMPAADAELLPLGEPLPAKRILLCEDNPINTMVATELLTRMGHQVVAVANGKQAVEAVAGGDYDVVLMDVMMPEMDGLTASRIIKSTDKGRGLPIIALTANTLRDRHTAAKAAGMEFVIQKPVSRQRLERGLRDLFASEVTEDSSEQNEAGLSDALPILDEDTYRQFFDEMGDAGAQRLMNVFIDQTTLSIEQLVRETEVRKIVVAAHSMKSAAGLFGFLRLAAIAEEIEQTASEGDHRLMILALAKAFEESKATAAAPQMIKRG